MKLNKKIAKSLIVLTGVSGLVATSPIYAGYYYPYHHYYPHYYHHGRNLAAGLFLGAAVGLIAGAALSQGDDYQSCRQVYDDHYCQESYWGEECYTVRHVRYVC